MESKPLSINELKDAFFSLKMNKSSGVEDVSFNIIKKCFGVALRTLDLPISAVSWKGGISRWFKNCKSDFDDSDISNYRPISVLPCFSKILECLMYNCLYKYLKENNILYEKQFDLKENNILYEEQFGFQGGYSTIDAIVQLVDKIFYSFEKE